MTEQKPQRKYIVPKAQTVEIEWNKVVNKSFENILKRGDLKVVKTEYSSQRLLIDKATFYEWLKSQTHYKIVEGKEDFYDREELSEAQ